MRFASRRGIVSRFAGSSLAVPRVLALRRNARRGNAAIEAALLFPVLIAMVFGLIDASNALIAYRRITAAAEQTALIATELSVEQGGSTSLTQAQLYQAGTAIFGLFPGLEQQGSNQVFSVTVSSVFYSKAPSGCVPAACTYTANVAWSVPLSTFVGQYEPTPQYLGGTVTRSCGTLTQVPQTTTPTLTNIPTQGMTSLVSVLIVDISYKFTPRYTKLFLSPVTFWRTAFLPPRLDDPNYHYVTYDTANAGTDAYVCVGFE